MARRKKKAAVDEPVVEAVEVVAEEDTQPAVDPDILAAVEQAGDGAVGENKLDDDPGLVDAIKAQATVEHAQGLNINESVKIVADADLRVAVPNSATVFRLLANVERQLPKRLALAAQMAGAQEGVLVTVSPLD